MNKSVNRVFIKLGHSFFIIFFVHVLAHVAYKVFDKDFTFCRRRLETLERNNETKESPEAKRHRMWLRNYEQLFKKIGSSNCDITSDGHSPLTVLCPVTWKTLETICYYKLLQNLPFLRS